MYPLKIVVVKEPFYCVKKKIYTLAIKTFAQTIYKASSNQNTPFFFPVKTKARRNNTREFRFGNS